ncbi:MAG: cyclic nucleotide-binding domain-containing protein [Bacteriovoracaceae bacterium]
MSYEQNERESHESGKPETPRIEIPLVKYFWQSNTLNREGKDNIPKFFRNTKMLSAFNDNELRILTKHFHLRNFEPNEVIFEQDQTGFGFYVIYSGQVDILVKQTYSKKESSTQATESEEKLVQVANLEKNDYFGELALVQDNSIRTATAVASESCSLLGMFKPDMDQLLEYHPHIAAKFLKAISMLLANRITNVTSEIKTLKLKIELMEKNVSEKKL